MEGTPGHREASPVTGRRGPWPWPPPHEPARSRRRADRDGKRRKRQGCQRFDPVERRGKKTPTLGNRNKPGAPRQRVRTRIRRSGAGVVKRPRPWSRRAEDSRVRAAPSSRKVRERTRNTRGSGARDVVRVAFVGRTHRASSLSGGRKASWWQRALAGRKPQAPHDAGQGWREGETVRGSPVSKTGSRGNRHAGFGSRAHETMEGVLGPARAPPSPAEQSEVLRLAGNPGTQPARAA